MATKKKNPKTFSPKKMKAIRGRSAMSGADLAEAVGVARMTIYRFEEAGVVPDAEVLYRIAAALAVRPDDLME